MTTPLGRKLAGEAPRAAGSKLSHKLAAGRRGEHVTLPFLGTVRIELIGTRESQEVEGEVYRTLAELGIPQNGMTGERFELERAVRTLARAVRDADDPAHPPFGSVEDWLRLDADLIVPAWHAYGDVRERLDPFERALDEDETILMNAALKKKDPTLWRSFGIAKLSAWLTSMGDRLSISPDLKSSSGEPSSDTSDSGSPTP